MRGDFLGVHNKLKKVFCKDMKKRLIIRDKFDKSELPLDKCKTVGSAVGRNIERF